VWVLVDFELKPLMHSVRYKKANFLLAGMKLLESQKVWRNLKGVMVVLVAAMEGVKEEK
jgi:hypothetical protein